MKNRIKVMSTQRGPNDKPAPAPVAKPAPAPVAKPKAKPKKKEDKE
jgi:hypothetical protein